MFTPMNAILIILITGIFLSVIIERRRKQNINSLINLAVRTVSSATTVEERLKTGFQKCFDSIDTAQLQHRIKTGSLTQIAETVIYTKRRIRTYYDHETGEAFSFREVPTFFFAGAEIDPLEFKAIIESKTKPFPDQRKVKGSKDRDKVIPLFGKRGVV